MSELQVTAEPGVPQVLTSRELFRQALIRRPAPRASKRKAGPLFSPFLGPPRQEKARSPWH